MGAKEEVVLVKKERDELRQQVKRLGPAAEGRVVMVEQAAEELRAKRDKQFKYQLSRWRDALTMAANFTAADALKRASAAERKVAAWARKMSDLESQVAALQKQLDSSVEIAVHDVVVEQFADVQRVLLAAHADSAELDRQLAESRDEVEATRRAGEQVRLDFNEELQDLQINNKELNMLLNPPPGVARTAIPRSPLRR